MSDKSKEDFYDAEIAPKLLELARLCSDRGIPFLAAVEFDGGVGRTQSKFDLETASAHTALIYAACVSGGNFDLLVNGVRKLPHAVGHDSVYLHMFEN